MESNKRYEVSVGEVNLPGEGVGDIILATLKPLGVLHYVRVEEEGCMVSCNADAGRCLNECVRIVDFAKA